MSSLKKHKTADMIKWIITSLVLVAIIGAVISLFVKLDRQTTTTTIGGESYSIGTLDTTTGEYSAVNTSIVLRNGVTVDGLKCELKDNSKIEYAIFYYDADGEFISATETLTADYSESAPETAKTAKIMITPTEDEDGKVSLTEVLGYANQLKVTVNR